VAVCDIDPQKATDLSNKYNAHAYTEITELLHQEKSIDLIAVCTPNFLHAEHTIGCLRNGFHVLCEKPMAIHVSDCKKMILEAGNAEKELFIVKQNRFNPPVLAVKGLLEENKLGAIYSVHLNCIWNRNADYYVNTWKGEKGNGRRDFIHPVQLFY
jgi:UDP-N-acetyl-2-amino-2-deoxyglucuronate dehydrogenase